MSDITSTDRTQVGSNITCSQANRSTNHPRTKHPPKPRVRSDQLLISLSVDDAAELGIACDELL